MVMLLFCCFLLSFIYLSGDLQLLKTDLLDTSIFGQSFDVLELLFIVYFSIFLWLFYHQIAMNSPSLMKVKKIKPLFIFLSYLKEGSSGMAVIEIGYPSGFSADKTSIDKHKLLKRIEDGDKKVILYLDEVNTKTCCMFFFI